MATALDRIIKRVPSAKKMGKVISVDAKTGQILSKSSWFSKIGKDLRHYEVTERNISVECEGLVTKVKDFATKKAINIQVAYDISLIKGSEEKLVLAIYQGDNPTEVIEERLDSWIKEFSKQQLMDDVNFIENFYSLKRDLIRHLTQKASDELGVNLLPYLTLEGEEKLDIHKPKSNNFFIRVKDYDEPISMKFEVGLEVKDGDERIKAILNYNRIPRLEGIIQNEITKFTTHHCTLHEFCYGLNDSVKQKIIRIIDPILAKEGRRTAYLSLSAETERLKIDETPLLTHETKCKIKDSQPEIKVENRVIMNLIDLGKFRQQNVESIQHWVSTRLDKIVQDIFFERTRIDLLDTLDDDRNAIREKLSKVAESIGFEVKHLAFVPDLDELTLLNGFDTESDKENFKTQDSRVDINLELKIYAKVGQIKDVTAFLNDGTEKFKAKVLSEAQKVVERKLREKLPAEIYASSFEVNNSIDIQLKESIAEELHRIFKLEDITVNLIFHANEIAIKVRQLQKEFPSFTFFVTPFVNGEYIKVEYIVAYNVERVDKYGWHSFQANDLPAKMAIVKMNKTLKSFFKSRLDTIPANIILYKDYETLRKIENVIVNDAKKLIIEKFGVVIRFDPLRRELSDLEKQAVELKTQLLQQGHKMELETALLESEQLQEQLKTLYEERNQILVGGDEEDLEEIDEKIERVKAKMPKSFLDDYSSQHKHLSEGQKGDSVKPFSFEDFNNNIKSIGESNPPHNNNNDDE